MPVRGVVMLMAGIVAREKSDDVETSRSYVKVTAGVAPGAASAAGSHLKVAEEYPVGEKAKDPASVAGAPGAAAVLMVLR